MATTKTTTEPAAEADPKTKALPEDAYQSEQFKSGPGPETPAVEPTEKVKPVETKGHEPYPTGSPPDPEESFKRIHGYARKEE